jgi:hypothetical protein
MRGRPELCRIRGSGGSPEPASATDAGGAGWTPTLGGSLSLSVSAAAAVLLPGDDSVVVSAVVTRFVVRSGVRVSVLRSAPAPGASAWTDGFGGSAFEAFGAAAEPSELELPPEGDGLSARAIPLANPTVTQADSTNATSVNRNHQ